MGKIIIVFDILQVNWNNKGIAEIFLDLSGILKYVWILKTSHENFEFKVKSYIILTQYYTNLSKQLKKKKTEGSDFEYD